jgi:hypothetical protein
LIALCAVLAGLLMQAPASQARPAAVTLSLYVTFSPTGTITVALPDGTPVGASSGAPTLIPAGYYTLVMSGPGACTQLPTFELKGPGEDISSDMTAGEVDMTSQEAYFRPSSTYMWRNSLFPSVLHTFVTTATAEGSVPVATPPGAANSKSTVSSKDIVGSGNAPFRGTLAGTVDPAGKLSLAFKGRGLTSLKAGRYTITVTDRSGSSGLLLQKAKRAAVAITGPTFVGKRSASVTLTPGRWSFATRAGGRAAYSIDIT